MQGHVINERFKGSPGIWAVQRKDVDDFFGSFFESDYLLGQRMTGKRVLDFFFEKVLLRLAQARDLFSKAEASLLSAVWKGSCEACPEWIRDVRYHPQRTRGPALHQK